MFENIDSYDFTECFQRELSNITSENIHDEIMESEVNISLLRIGERTLPPWKGLPEAIREERIRIKMLRQRLNYVSKL